MSLFDDLEKIKKSGNFCGTFELLDEFSKMADKLENLRKKFEERKDTTGQATEQPASDTGAVAAPISETSKTHL